MSKKKNQYLSQTNNWSILTGANSCQYNKINLFRHIYVWQRLSEIRNEGHFHQNQFWKIVVDEQKQLLYCF